MKKRFLFLWLFFAALSAFAQQAVVTAPLSASAASCQPSTNTTACLFLTIDPKTNTVGVEISGTYSGTLQFVGIVNATLVSVQATPSTGGTAVTSTTSTGTWTIPAAGYSYIGVRCSTYSSGVATVSLNPSQAVIAGSGSGATGSVTSVGLTLNAGATCGAAAVTGSPVTTSGTLNINFVGVNGDIVTFNGSNCLSDSATLLSSMAPLASPTFTGVVTVPAGGVGAASIAFTGDTAGSGLYRAGTVTYGFTNASNQILNFSSGGIKVTSGAVYGMTASSTSSTGSFDTCWHRSAAGVFGFDADGACSNEAGLLRAGNACRPVGDITLTVNTDITICQWSLPPVAKLWAWQCQIPWVLSAGSGTNTLIIKINPSQAPTGATTGSAEIKTTNTNTATEATVAIPTSAGAVTLLTSPTITPGAGVFMSSVSGSVAASATAGTLTLTYQAAGTTATALAKAGGSCWLY